jgi:hypothetical protein
MPRLSSHLLVPPRPDLGSSLEGVPRVRLFWVTIPLFQ